MVTIDHGVLCRGVYLFQRSHFDIPWPFPSPTRRATQRTDGQEEPKGGPGEAHGERQPLADAEPHAAVHIEGLVEARDEHEGGHPKAREDRPHRQEDETRASSFAI